MIGKFAEFGAKVLFLTILIVAAARLVDRAVTTFFFTQPPAVEQTGPFRPRPPKPPVPLPPEPQPKDEQERALFERLRGWVEQRAEARAEAKVAELLDEVGASLEAVTYDQPELVQNALGAVLAAKLMAFVKKVVGLAVASLIASVLLALAAKYWAFILPAFLAAVTAVAWPAGYRAGKSATGK